MNGINKSSRIIVFLPAAVTDYARRRLVTERPTSLT
jgi:hypothetical protein